jgi:hypothetical protein
MILHYPELIQKLTKLANNLGDYVFEEKHF